MMSEDSLLRELGRLAQEEKEAEEARRDERWDRLAAGTLGAAEEGALRALAATSPAVREAYEAFRPLGADFQARVVAALESEIRRPAAAAEPREPRSRLLQFRPRTWWFAGSLAAAAVAASGLFLVVRGPATMPPLPLYSAELSGGIQTLRGGPGPATGPQPFAPGSRLSLVVQPERAVSEVEARALLGRGAEIVPWQPAPRLDISAKGAVRLEGTIGEDIRLPPGPERVWIVVGRRGKIPLASELAT
ncbi:MAG TPA: hypothetical protein VHB47_10695, partial [Thermoanaerobaculia bacterium]|nr:hypothetical protein [Thermoanaerobaculia bacterium]